LRQRDSSRADRILTRADESFARIAPLFPGDQATGILSEDYEESVLFADESDESIGNSEPCPVLDPTTGTCDLYEHRPIVCRTFGPPMRTPEGDLATCELCFITASTEEISACELDPAIPELDGASNKAYDTEHHLSGETLVVFALRHR
jgi:Fe-S-cluster containining protein